MPLNITVMIYDLERPYGEAHGYGLLRHGLSPYRGPGSGSKRR